MFDVWCYLRAACRESLLTRRRTFILDKHQLKIQDGPPNGHRHYGFVSGHLRVFADGSRSFVWFNEVPPLDLRFPPI